MPQQFSVPQPIPGPAGYYTYPAPAPVPRSGRRGWLWAGAGVVGASLIWVVILIITLVVRGGTGGGGPDLRGYRYTDNLCAAVDTSAIQSAGFTRSDTGQKHAGTQHSARDDMTCSDELHRSGTLSYDNSTLFTEIILHKKTDPGPEFTAAGETAGSLRAGIDQPDVQKVSGIGDEAYVTVRKSAGDLGFDVALDVRDGWVTYSGSWYDFGSASSYSNPPVTTSEATDALKKSAAATLAKLRK
jgi:hypothetical protein